MHIADIRTVILGLWICIMFYLTELSSMNNFMIWVKMKAFGSQGFVTWVLVVLGAC